MILLHFLGGPIVKHLILTITALTCAIAHGSDQGTNNQAIQTSPRVPALNLAAVQEINELEQRLNALQTAHEEELANAQKTYNENMLSIKDQFKGHKQELERENTRLVREHEAALTHIATTINKEFKREEASHLQTTKRLASAMNLWKQASDENVTLKNGKVNDWKRPLIAAVCGFATGATVGGLGVAYYLKNGITLRPKINVTFSK